MLEIVAEGEVAQHLKVGAVTGGFAHVVDIAGADALLTGAHPVAGRLLLALEPGLHGGVIPALISRMDLSFKRVVHYSFISNCFY